MFTKLDEGPQVLCFLRFSLFLLIEHLHLFSKEHLKQTPCKMPIGGLERKVGGHKSMIIVLRKKVKQKCRRSSFKYTFPQLLMFQANSSLFLDPERGKMSHQPTLLLPVHAFSLRDFRKEMQCYIYAFLMFLSHHPSIKMESGKIWDVPASSSSTPFSSSQIVSVQSFSLSSPSI